MDGDPSSARSQILTWLASGHLTEQNFPAALGLLGAQRPSEAEWRKFLANVALAAGTLLCAAGIIFFFAFNWKDLPRLGRFAIVESLLAAAAGFAIWKGVSTLAGRAAIFFAAVLTGALFALIGQTYQMGADPWELFALWSILILPWCLAVRQPDLWILALLTANTAIQLNRALESSREIWFTIALNIGALALAEWRAPSQRLLSRLILAWILFRLTADAVTFAFRIGRRMPEPGAYFYLLVIVAAFVFYRYARLDAAALAMGGLSTIFVLGALTIGVLDSADAILITFCTGMVVIGSSAAVVWWIRSLTRSEPSS